MNSYNIVIHYKWAAALARKSANFVANLGLIGFNNFDFPLTRHPVLMQLHSFSVMIDRLEVIFKR